MERRFLPGLWDYGWGLGNFATRWDGWKNPRHRGAVARTTGRINVSHPSAIDDIVDEMGLYVALYEPAKASRYVVYVGYSKKLRTELKIRYGKWKRNAKIPPGKLAKYPFAAFYLSSQRDARAYEMDLIRYYCPPWNTKFHP